MSFSNRRLRRSVKTVTAGIYVMEREYDTIIADTTDGSVIVIIPALNTLKEDLEFEVVKAAEENVVVVSAADISIMEDPSHPSFLLRELGHGVCVSCISTLNQAFYKEFEYAIGILALDVTTVTASLSGTTLTVVGNIQHMMGETNVGSSFKWKKSTDTLWTETANIDMTESGDRTELITVGTAGVDYDVQFTTITNALDTYSGNVISSADNFYPTIEAAINDGMVRYWAMEEESASNALETLGSGDVLLQKGTLGNFAFSSDVINSRTRWKRYFGADCYLESSLSLPVHTPYTIMVEVDNRNEDDRHAVFTTGGDILELGSKDNDWALLADGSRRGWNNPLPDSEIQLMFITVDPTEERSRLYVAASGTLWTMERKISTNHAPETTGWYFRVGRGAVGGYFDESDYLEDGYIRSIGIWNKLLTEGTMAAIANALHTEGTLVVE